VIRVAKVKFGQRLVRSFVYGIPLGFIMYILGSVASGSIHGLPSNLGTLGFVVGFGSAIGIELSKDLEQS